MPTLTETHVRNVKAREKPYKLFDELGLFLLVTPNADTRKGRLWRLRYRYADVEKRMLDDSGIAYSVRETIAVSFPR